MFDLLVLLWSIIFLLANLLQVIRKKNKLPYFSLPSHEGGGGDVDRGTPPEEEAKVSRMERKRPARITIPEPPCAGLGFCEEASMVGRDVVVDSHDYCMASRRGARHAMEDGYSVLTDINGDSKKAFFGVFDGHGGRAAVDFVSKKLGKNIVVELVNGEGRFEDAIRRGYMNTDKEFLSQGVKSGACAATASLNNGVLHVANLGDCRVVMSRKGVARALTIDHRPSRKDERNRIESSGGFVSCGNGMWRVQDSLAVSRSFGDASMKEWVISEPDINMVQLESTCEFIIIASDGLWDKVTNQEAVDVVLRGNKQYMKSCEELVEMSSRRGNMDDITVMIVDLAKFI